jgi:4-phytase / acid phosphatase
MTRTLWLLACCFLLTEWLASAQSISTTVPAAGAHLQFVVYLTRHGVRSPTGDSGQYDAYSSAIWPKWSVPPGNLTPHGFELMKLFGAYDRSYFARHGLLSPNGCTGASRIVILADSDERTRDTAEALAKGMFPACPVSVKALPENHPDPLFHSMRAGVGKPDRALAFAAIEGRIGGNASNLTAAYRPQLNVLDHILAGCGRTAGTNFRRISIFDVPSSQRRSHGDRSAKLRGPLSVGSSMAETLLLEYAEGMKGADLGWGCLNEGELREVMQIHTAHVDYTERTPVIARMDASNLLDHILAALEQSVARKPVPGAPGKPGDHALFLVGHDTNIVTVAGLLNLNWILDGRRDDTPPGGALIFELWRSASGEYSVRVFYTAQTLEQMRQAQRLTLANPPPRVPVFVPGCGRKDMSCSLDEFAATVRRSINPAYVSAAP